MAHLRTSEIFLLTCQSLILDEHPELKAEISGKLGYSQESMDRFIAFSSNQFVLPAVWLKLRNAGLDDLFAKEYRDYLNEVYHLNLQRNNKILAQVKEISAALAKEHIEPVYMKGTGNLLAGLYSSPGERMIGDIDFLVEEKNYDRCIKTITNLGYSTDVKQYDGPKSWKHYPRLFRKDVPADVEIHFVPVNFKYSREFNGDIIFTHCKAIHTKENTYVPSIQHRLIQTFIHSQLSNKGHRLYTPGLRDMYDARLLMLQTDDLQDVIKQIEKKERAKVFFDYIRFLFDPDQKLSGIKNKRNVRYIKRQQWFWDHPRFHLMYMHSFKLYELIVIRYITKIFRAVFNKKELRYIINRIKDPAWYGNHIKGVSKQFFGK